MRRAVLVALLLGFVVWGFLATSALLEGRDRAQASQQALNTLADVDPVDADLEEVEVALREASTDLRVARRRLGSPLLAPLRPVPVLGRQLASARALAVSADRVVASILPAVERVVDARSRGAGAQHQVELLVGLQSDLTRASAVLAHVDLGPEEALVAPLAEARYDAAVELSQLADAVDQALTVVRGVRAFLESSTYVVLAANPAEMANAGGMLLSIGELHVDGGRFDLEEFRHSHELFPVSDVPVRDGDIQDRWGHLIPANDFRKLNLTPRFADYSAPQSLDMWEALTGRRPDGAIVVDPLVVQALLEVVGPVEVDGVTYEATSILSYAIEEQYARFQDEEDQGARRELVASIATAAVDALVERSWDPIQLIRHLRPAVEGRHLMAFSEDPRQQAMWSTVGAAGALEGNEVLVNLASRAGHKIDSFVPVRVDAHREGEVLRLDVEVANRVPPELTGFAEGAPGIFGDNEPGTYVGRLVIFTPGATTRVGIDPPGPLEAYGPDGAGFVTAIPVQIDPGVTVRFRVEVTLAADVDIVVLPSARVPPVTWTSGGETWTDTERRPLPRS